MNFDRRTTPYKGDKAIIIVALDPLLIGQQVLTLSDPEKTEAMNFTKNAMVTGVFSEVTVPESAESAMKEWALKYPSCKKFVFPTTGLLRIPPDDELQFLYGVKEKPVEA